MTLYVLEIESVRKDLKDQLRIVEADIFNRLEKLLLNKNAKVGRKKLKIDKALLESMKPQKWFEIKLQNQKLNDELETYYKAHKELEKEFKQKLTFAPCFCTFLSCFVFCFEAVILRNRISQPLPLHSKTGANFF